MTSRRIPRAGDKYRHFKGNNYQIITIAKDSETLAPMVVYQGLYGDFEIYVRPMSDFLAELDKSTYPEATQQYRFEPLDGSESGAMDYSAGYETSAAPHREAVATPRDTTAPAFQTAAAPASRAVAK